MLCCIYALLHELRSDCCTRSSPAEHSNEHMSKYMYACSNSGLDADPSTGALGGKVYFSDFRASHVYTHALTHAWTHAWAHADTHAGTHAYGPACTHTIPTHIPRHMPGHMPTPTSAQPSAYIRTLRSKRLPTCRRARRRVAPNAGHNCIGRTNTSHNSAYIGHSYICHNYTCRHARRRSGAVALLRSLG